MDTIKTKLQTFPNRYNNFIDCAKKTFVQHGLAGLYAGTLPSLLANAAGKSKANVKFIENQWFSLENGILFMSYGQCQQLVCSLREKNDYNQLTSVENMAAGSLAAVFASLALCPTELVKCRLQTLNELSSGSNRRM